MPLLRRDPLTPPAQSAQATGVLQLEALGSPAARSRQARFRPGWLDGCSNHSCSSGWLHLWRKRAVPVFEDGWTCSPECTASRVLAAVTRELAGMEVSRAGHRHRIPIGLLMLEHGWITPDQLRRALDAQKEAGTGRLGRWLVDGGASEESTIARALALQWSCPVLTLEGRVPVSVTSAMPRLFVDAFAALPLRVTAGKTLYLGFEESLDPVLALAIQRMTGLRVVSGIVPESRFHQAHAQLLKEAFPSVELIESASEAAAAHALARSIERARPVAARLVRVHECLWLRMWLHPQIEPLPECETVRDVVCLIGAL